MYTSMSMDNILWKLSTTEVLLLFRVLDCGKVSRINTRQLNLLKLCNQLLHILLGYFLFFLK